MAFLVIAIISSNFFFLSSANDEGSARRFAGVSFSLSILRPPERI